MIYTVTLNPALDRTLYVESLVPGESTRIRREARYSGGKGIDVSRALREMGTRSVALGFVGGFDGKEFEGRLLLEGVACSFTPSAGETRTNVIIQDESRGVETALLAQGPEIQPSELMDFISRLEAIQDMEFLVVSGSLPPGLTPEVYRRVIQIGNTRGARTVLDTAGEALRQGVGARPFAIKPNRQELAELAGQEFADLPAMVRYCRELGDRVKVVLVSLGRDGMILVTAQGAWHAVPPEVKVRSTVGAGDCALAGFVHAVAQGEELTAALCRAVASGTATTLNPGTALCRCDDIDALLPQIALKELKI